MRARGDSARIFAPEAALRRIPRRANAGRWRALAIALHAFETAAHTLHLYGAAGIAAFGWAICRRLGCQAGPWLPLWFCAAVLVYNLDRIRPDPADDLNTPHRVAAARRWRRWSIALALAAAAALVGLPLMTRDWLTLFLAIFGSVVCLHYSAPFRGRRWKDVPLLKTFFAPAVVAAAVFGLPLLHEPAKFAAETPLVMVWASALLLANMILCDCRDLAGDRARGVVSLPEWLGPRGTRTLLWFLVALSAAAPGILALHEPLPWLAHAIGGASYLSLLVFSVREPRRERFYERWVEGLLFVPAAVELACSAL